LKLMRFKNKLFLYRITIDILFPPDVIEASASVEFGSGKRFWNAIRATTMRSFRKWATETLPKHR